MGLFDDLIPQSSKPASSHPSRSGGLFDDLIPTTDIDYNAGTEEVRAKIAALPEEKRKAAHDAWADARVAKGPMQLPDPVKGIPIIGGLTDELAGGINSALYSVTGGYVGRPYDEAVATERAKHRAAKRNFPILNPVTEMVSGIATGGPLLSKLAPAKTLSGQMVQGSMVGGPLAAAEGFVTEGTLGERAEAARDHFLPGVGFGLAAPLVLRGVGVGVQKSAEALSPQLARVAGTAKGIKEKLAMRMSADGSMPPPSYGADAAADQIIANQAVRAGLTVPQLRQRMAEADEAARFGTNSSAQNVLAPVDMDPAFQRLAGSVARQQPEAANIGTAFQYARQTGQPSGLDLPDNVGIPIRAPMAKPQTGDPPMGQYERINDALRKAFQIDDAAFHGHAKTAFATDQMLIKRAKDGARQLYGAAEKAADGYDIRPHVEPVLNKWLAASVDEPPAVASAIRAFARQYQPASGVVSDLQKFQKAKEFSDGIIEKWLKSPEGRNKYVAGRLVEFQHELLDSIDSIATNGIGKAYSAARDQFAGEMRLRDALKLGRDTLRDDSEVVVDQFRQLATEGERKVARLGLSDAYRQLAARKGRSDDVTRIFASPRVQEILTELIPRPRTAGAVFADRPERFGQYLANESRMIQTRNQTMKGSPTAERLADDEALNNMQAMIDAAKQSASNPSASGMIVRIMETALSKLFGFRSDTAAAIARKLYTANPIERERLLQNIERRMGPGRAAHFARVVSEMTPSVPGGVGAYGGNDFD